MAQNPALPAVIALQKVPRCAVLADAVPAPAATAATTAAPRAADRRNAVTSAGFSVISTIITNFIVLVRRLPGFGEDCPRQLGPRCPVPATSSSSASLETAGHTARRCGHHRRPGRAGTHPGARRWRWIPGSDLADPQHRVERLTKATALPANSAGRWYPVAASNSGYLRVRVAMLTTEGSRDQSARCRADRPPGALDVVHLKSKMPPPSGELRGRRSASGYGGLRKSPDTRGP